jgi:quinone-modifying oxidoreductase subunit QmoC
MPAQTTTQATTQIIKPDLNFINDVIKSGGESLKKCFQCATCSVVCNVTPDDKPFPRKEMMYAQWGMKDRLINNPDIWLCHHCKDCTAYCPRGAKPGEVIGAIRSQFIQSYSPVNFFGKMVSKPSYLVFILAIPVFLLLAVLAHLGNLDFTAIERGAGGEIVYSKFMPHVYVIAIYVSVAMFSFLSFAAGVNRYWKALLSNNKEGEASFSIGSIFKSIVSTVQEILAHKEFEKCDTAKERKISHILTFYGFIGLAMGTTWATVYKYGFDRMPPYPLTDPMQWLTNISTAAFLVGLSMIIYNRMKDSSKSGIGSYFDWIFIAVLVITGITGFAAQVFRLADIGVLAYSAYFFHLVFIFYLFAYAPFSKFAHMIYRTTAMVFAKHSERKV